MAHDEEKRARRRFLKNFQERVGPFLVQVVGAIDDADTPPALACGRAEERHRLAHVVNRDVAAQVALVVKRALQHEEIAMPLRDNTADDRIFGGDK